MRKRKKQELIYGRPARQMGYTQEKKKVNKAKDNEKRNRNNWKEGKK